MLNTRTPVERVESFPHGKISEKGRHTQKVKKNGYIEYTAQHLVPSSTSLRANTVQIQDDRMNKFHYAFTALPIWTSV